VLNQDEMGEESRTAEQNYYKYKEMSREEIISTATKKWSILGKNYDKPNLGLTGRASVIPSIIFLLHLRHHFFAPFSRQHIFSQDIPEKAKAREPIDSRAFLYGRGEPI
jgi:hypothetical protein